MSISAGESRVSHCPPYHERMVALLLRLRREDFIVGFPVLLHTCEAKRDDIGSIMLWPTKASKRWSLPCAVGGRSARQNFADARIMLWWTEFPKRHLSEKVLRRTSATFSTFIGAIVCTCCTPVHTCVFTLRFRSLYAALHASTCVSPASWVYAIMRFSNDEGPFWRQRRGGDAE
jgi:hypothetical protein